MKKEGKHCGKGEIVAEMSNFTFFHNVFYAVCIFKSFDSHISDVLCSFFKFGMLSNGVLGNRLRFYVNMYFDKVRCCLVYICRC